MARAADAIRYWFTVEETGYDPRTGTSARSRERHRDSRDKPGKELTVWDWSVARNHNRLGAGTAQNQKGARAAIRKLVRALPDKDPK